MISRASDSVCVAAVLRSVRGARVLEAVGSTYRALLPQAAGRVHQRLDLRGCHAEARGDAEHKAVVLGDVRSRRDLVLLADARRSHLGQYLVRERLFDTEKRDLAADGLEALLHLERHGADVPVHAVVYDTDLRACAWARQRERERVSE